MDAFFALVYIAGMVGTVVVGRARAGLSQRGRLSAATMALSLPWVVTQLGSMFVWPAVLVVWLVRGRPESPWESTVNRNGTVRVIRVSPSAGF